MGFSESFYHGREKALSNKSTTERGNEKKIIALDWVYRWKYSSASVLDQSGGCKRRGLSAKLVKCGYLKSTKTIYGNGLKDVPGHILTLTSEGLRVVETYRENLIEYEIDPYRIRQDQLRHYQIAQTLTMNSINQGHILEFFTEQESSHFSIRNVKQPDVVWVLQNNKKVGLEIELTAKWDRKLDQFIASCVHALTEDEQRVAKLNHVAIYSDSRALVKRYKQAFEPGTLYSTWEKNNRGIWVTEKKLKIPEWIKGKVTCKTFLK